MTSRTVTRASRLRARSVPTNSSTKAFAGRARISSGVPYWTSRPSRRMAIRSPILIASSTSCVTKTTVLRIAFRIFRNSFCNRPRVIGSMAPKGSSMSMTGGSPARARATPTRCRCPPESSRGYRVRWIAGSMPTRVSISSTRAAIRAAGQPTSLGTVAMFSAIVMWGNRPICWMTYPMRRRSATGSIPVTSSPPTTMRPPVGSTSRLIIFSVVVLPQPDGPIRTQVWPAGTSRLNWSTAGVACPGKILVSDFRRIMTIPTACPWGSGPAPGGGRGARFRWRAGRSGPPRAGAAGAASGRSHW